MNATKVPIVSVPSITRCRRRGTPRRVPSDSSSPGTPPDRYVQQLHRHQRVDERVVAPRGIASTSRSCAFDATTSLMPCSVSIRKLPIVGAALAHALRPRFERSRDSAQAPRRERQSRQRHQRTAARRATACDDAADEEQHVADPRERDSAATRWISPMSLLMRAHDVAEPACGVEARRQPLQMAVQRQPHVEQDVGRDARVAQAADDVQREAGERDQREQADDAHERAGSRPSSARSTSVLRELAAGTATAPC